jgi:hypothetical protein
MTIRNVKNNRPLSILDLLFLPIGMLMQIPPALVGLVALVGFGVCAFFYYTTNSDFGGLARPAFENLEVSEDFGEVTSTTTRRSWKITYEYFGDSTFAGVVRHVSHWREDSVPFATHDVLVTTEDFADPKQVDTSVYNHRFRYTYPAGVSPKGNINLLHIVPLNEEIYKQLLNLRDWNNVTIKGREIFKIDMYDPQGAFTGYWQDEGCNTILVKSVAISK